MTMDKSLRFQVGLVRARSVLTRGERIAKLKETDRWADGRSPLGLPKVRVQKLTMKKKKKAKEETAEGEAAAVGAPGAAPAAGAAAPAAGAKAAAGSKPAAGAKAPAAAAKAPPAKSAGKK